MGKVIHKYNTEQATVYKQSPLGFWTPREAGWVLYREDSQLARGRVQKKIDNGTLLRVAPTNDSKRVLITTKELERLMRQRFPGYKLNEKAYMQGVDVKVRYKVSIEE